MRKTLFAVIMLMISAGQANAAWTDDFLQDYSKFGIDRAVDNALAKAKKTPADILQFILTQNDALKTKITMKALYCSGVDKDIMRQATEQLSIEAEEREVALAESTEECGSLLTLSDRDILDVPSSNNGIGRRQQQPKPPKQPSVRGGREEGAAPSISVPPPTIPSLSSPNQTK